ncbi:MAG: hypothetical protein WD045_14030, partial [Pirellulaceae bacterium]
EVREDPVSSENSGRPLRFHLTVSPARQGAISGTSSLSLPVGEMSRTSHSPDKPPGLPVAPF